ncbi:MAG TPA: hypothetical protein VIL78_05700 [Hanamia sp.]
MKYQNAKDFIPKFTSLIGKPTKDSFIKKICVSFIEKSLAEDEFRHFLLGMGKEGFNPKYEGDYTLWAWLDNDSILPVKCIVNADNVQDLFEDAKFLD